MKVIELLNKIANGEEVPKKIKWEDTIFVYSEYDKDYLEYPFSDEEYQGLFCMKDSILTQFLDDEVEILEEEKKIPEKLIKLNNVSNSSDLIALSQMQWENNKLIENKINEIIDYLKSKGE